MRESADPEKIGKRYTYQNISTAELVPGDIIMITPNMILPCDVLLIAVGARLLLMLCFFFP